MSTDPLYIPGAAAAAGEIEFADGLFGFPECKRFLLSATGRPGFFWLQSLEAPTIAFVLVDPFVVVDDYVVDLADTDVARIGARKASDVAILAIATLSRDSDAGSTINLQAPVAINVALGAARQVILEDTDFGIRYPLNLTK